MAQRLLNVPISVIAPFCARVIRPASLSTAGVPGTHGSNVGQSNRVPAYEVVMLRGELRERDQRIHQIEEKLQSVESDTDSLEQNTRRNSEDCWYNYTEKKKTDKDPTEKVMELVNSTLDAPLDITAVDAIHRVGKPRAILAKLATYRSRKRIVDLRPQTKTLPDVFRNEDLTKKREDLLYKARVLRRAGKIQGAWSAVGNMLIHDLQGKIHKSDENFRRIEDDLMRYDWCDVNSAYDIV
ncbi:hypothetical protein CAPTEDRAFT_204702 [Capitella teleta]|uniref:Uncharacterized protein n=1 Tax=Capitella teleta TaxID=283909 RepID=R7V0Y2_CAPTE|nr:hypothetical protein CAPTEDRAFT_204702 [Capitella teleta]|eukprot:ELU12157.1 hypothetical protein CAPTEDRAFT_204702 [Capitella teleta]